MELASKDKEGAIREIAESLCVTENITDCEEFVKDVFVREALGSTGIGNNVGIPHARTSAVKGCVIGFGKSQQGIEFNALDGEKVNFIFLIGVDPGTLHLYLGILAELSKLIMSDFFRQTLISASTVADVIDIIKKFEQEERRGRS